MHRYGLVLAAVVLAGLPALAQTTPGATPGTAPGAATTPPGAPPAANAAAANAALDRYLLRWEQEMRKVQTLSANLNRIDKDPAFEAVKKYTGFAQYMKAGSGGPTTLNLASLE